MPRIDELLGVATIAAAGMAIALALEPLPSGSVIHAGKRAATVSVRPAALPLVRLPTVNVIARRGAEPQVNVATSPSNPPNT